MNIISSDQIPEPAGHYSPLIEHDGLLYMSGQLPIDPVTKETPLSIEEQTSLVLANVERLLHAAGGSRENVLRMRIYISDAEFWGPVNAIYARFFGDHRPVRTVVPVQDLHFGCKIEVEVTAVAPGRA